MSVPLSLRSALCPCLGVSSARAGKSLLSVTHSGKLRLVSGTLFLMPEVISNNCTLVQLLKFVDLRFSLPLRRHTLPYSPNGLGAQSDLRRLLRPQSPSRQYPTPH